MAFIAQNDKIKSFGVYDEDNRLHNLNGPAMGWADGRTSYFIHGVNTTQKDVELYKHLTEQNNKVKLLLYVKRDKKEYPCSVRYAEKKLGCFQPEY